MRIGTFSQPSSNFLAFQAAGKRTLRRCSTDFICAAEGGDAHAVIGDVGAKEDAHRIAGAVAVLIGAPSLVVHAASTLGPVPLVPILETACEDLERALAVNVLGPMRLSKIFLGPMLLAHEGIIVYVSSDAASEAYANWGAYGASKAALDQLARIWAAELAGTAIRTLVVDPGEMDTKMHADAIPDADRSTLARPDEIARRIVAIVTRAEPPANGSRLALGGAGADA